VLGVHARLRVRLVGLRPIGADAGRLRVRLVGLRPIGADTGRLRVRASVLGLASGGRCVGVSVRGFVVGVAVHASGLGPPPKGPAGFGDAITGRPVGDSVAVGRCPNGFERGRPVVIRTMRVETLGDGEPDVAVVAAIHGDEPCGVRAIERLLDENPAVQGSAKLIVANELALEREVRYVEEDMNRAFPGAPEADTHEARLAYRLGEELEGCRVLALHSTQSTAEPFAVVDGVHDFARAIVPHLPVAALVDSANFVEGRIFASAPKCVEVECGYQGSEGAAENAYSLTRAFLTAFDVLPGDTQPREVPVFRLFERVPKAAGSNHEVHVENFSRVAPGTTFASVDGDTHVADTEFYPVLMSANGYDEVFGYSAERIGVVG